jgi:hypothetical protein
MQPTSDEQQANQNPLLLLFVLLLDNLEIGLSQEIFITERAHNIHASRLSSTAARLCSIINGTFSLCLIYIYIYIYIYICFYII